MTNADRPEPLPPPTELFNTDPTITGYKLKGLSLTLPGGGISIALFRRTLVAPEKPGDPHRQTWFIVSELVLYPPLSVPEVLHTCVGWLGSYDPNLKDALGPLQEALSKLVELAPPPNAPQGAHLN